LTRKEKRGKEERCFSSHLRLSIRRKKREKESLSSMDFNRGGEKKRGNSLTPKPYRRKRREGEKKKSAPQSL